MDENTIIDMFSEWYNDEDLEDIKPNYNKDIVVYSRDWTIETILNQIRLHNIDLNPKFQRRNAWNDIRRSRLIESLILDLPVPEIVLAEDPKRKKSFIIIDGKQRLLTIAGYKYPESFEYWDKTHLKNLKVLDGLNGCSFADIEENSKYSDFYRQLMNSAMRCTVISNYSNNDILYDIFYRLNTGSVPLSSQELRQVLNKGPFADYLVRITNETQPIHKILNLDGPDPRLRDIEIILRFIAFYLNGENYKSNLKNFLDDTMKTITNKWQSMEKTINEIYSRFNKSIKKLEKVLEDNVARKYTDGKWERRFNKVLFEVEVYYFMLIDEKHLSESKNKVFIRKFKSLCNDNDFINSIQFSTKTLENYRNRFKLFKTLINDSYKLNIKKAPISLK